MSGRGRAIVYGALGGAVGSACMTALRLAARRRGAIDKTVSQTAEEWLVDRAGVHVPREPALHHALDQALHVGYGATLGAAYGLLVGRRNGQAGGALFGVATWLFGSWLLMPSLGAKRAPWRKSLVENATDLAAHTVYGVVTALVAGEMHRQPDHHRTSDALRQATRSG
jgi:hypothetical protein